MVREEIVFGDDECLCMRSYVKHGRVDTQQTQPNVEKAVRAHDNLVLRKVMLISNQQKVTWDSETRISEPERHTNSQTSKVWTIQMMTLILTPGLRAKRETALVSSRALINAQ